MVINDWAPMPSVRLMIDSHTVNYLVATLAFLIFDSFTQECILMHYLGNNWLKQHFMSQFRYFLSQRPADSQQIPSLCSHHLNQSWPCSAARCSILSRAWPSSLAECKFQQSKFRVASMLAWVNVALEFRIENVNFANACLYMSSNVVTYPCIGCWQLNDAVATLVACVAYNAGMLYQLLLGKKATPLRSCFKILPFATYVW